MANLEVLNQKGNKVDTLAVSDEVFGAEYNEALIHQVVVAQLANKRQGTKSTLTRTEVRGGGIKPWRQKGTGRARQGSIRAPQWIKGGVVFAPKPRDFSQKINKKMKDGAMRSALSEKIRSGEFVVVDKIELDAPKTKLMVEVLKALDVSKKALLVLSGDAEVARAAGNIDGVTTVADASLLNVYDVVANGKIVTTVAAVKSIEEAYAK